MNEIWIPIKGYEGVYAVSETGYVKRLIGYRACKERILKGSKVRGGYLMATLSVNDEHDRRMIHRIVGEHFVPNPDNKPFINHLDANPANNHKNNLEWATQAENIQYAHKIGNMGGVKSNLAKLTVEDVLAIKIKYAYGCSMAYLAKQINRRRTDIREILIGKKYSNVPPHILETSLRPEPGYPKKLNT